MFYFSPWLQCLLTGQVVGLTFNLDTIIMNVAKFTDIDFLIDNKPDTFGGRVFQQTVGISMGTNCAPLLADLFLIIMKLTSYRNFLGRKI